MYQLAYIFRSEYTAQWLAVRAICPDRSKGLRALTSSKLSEACKEARKIMDNVASKRESVYGANSYSEFELAAIMRNGKPVKSLLSK